MTSTAAALDPLAGDQDLRYRLDVIALDVAELVRDAGGWLYHRAAIGWDVHVLVPAQQDLRPLQILGVRTADLETELAAPENDPPGHSLAVVAEAMAADPRIGLRVQRALRCSVTELVFWGKGAPELDRRLSTVEHPLTVAGRAFKRQASVAAGVAPGTEPETFRSIQKPCLPVNSDLVPVK